MQREAFASVVSYVFEAQLPIGWNADAISISEIDTFLGLAQKNLYFVLHVHRYLFVPFFSGARICAISALWKVLCRGACMKLAIRILVPKAIGASITGLLVASMCRE
jgi:hypothetical protein